MRKIAFVNYFIHKKNPVKNIRILGIKPPIVKTLDANLFFQSEKKADIFFNSLPPKQKAELSISKADIIINIKTNENRRIKVVEHKKTKSSRIAVRRK